MGQHCKPAPAARRRPASDARSLFTPGTVNGNDDALPADTGASTVSLGAADAMRAGIDLRKAQPGCRMPPTA